MPPIDRHLLTFLVNALWQVPLVAAATWAACRFTRNTPAKYRHAICVLGLVAAVLLPVSGLRRASERPTVPVVQQIEPPALGPAVASRAVTVTSGPVRTVPVPRSAAEVVMWAAGLFLVYALARLAWAGTRTIAIRGSATPNTGPCPAWDRCREAFALEDAELRWSPTLAGPVAAGRMIILPAAMAAAPRDILDTAIGHEAAHLARRDFWTGLACELIAIPISFHPATAWLLRQIARTREEACDELVTARLLAPDRYARSLVAIAGEISGLGRRGYSLGMADGDHLEERVRRLLAPPAAGLPRARWLVVAGLATLAVCVVVASGLAISARAQTPGQVQMRAAADAYNDGRYAEAITLFEKAVALEPGNVNARLFLAGAYLRQSRREAAVEQYREALRLDPRNRNALSSFALLNTSSRPNESRELLMRAIELDPKDKILYYSLAVADWRIAYDALRAVKVAPGPEIYDQIPDPAVRAKVRDTAGPVIEEGFRALQIALDIDPGFSSAMAFMNLLARIKAALVDDPGESTRLTAQADEWVGKTLAAMKARAGEPKGAAMKIDVDGPPPAPIAEMIVAPPPPPPPPPGGFRGNVDGRMPPSPPPPPPGKEAR